jgi:hypothetical protein
VLLAPGTVAAEDAGLRAVYSIDPAASAEERELHEQMLQARHAPLAGMLFGHC